MTFPTLSKMELKKELGPSSSDSLDADVLGTVFSFLDAPALMRCRGVCKAWSSLAGSDFLWKPLYSRDVLPFESFPKQRYNFGEVIRELGEKSGGHARSGEEIHALGVAFRTLYDTYQRANDENARLGEAIRGYLKDTWHTPLRQKYNSHCHALIDCVYAAVKTLPRPALLVLQLSAAPRPRLSSPCKPSPAQPTYTSETAYAAEFLTDLVAQVAEILPQSCAVLHLSPKAAASVSSKLWKVWRRWTNLGNGSAYKFSRRKRDVQTKRPTVVICDDVNALRSAPWLSTKQNALVLLLQFADHGKSKSLPSWLHRVPLVKF